MQAESSDRERPPVIGCCHLNQMFSGNFTPVKSHRNGSAKHIHTRERHIWQQDDK